MDEFDIYLESTGSMSIYKDNTMAVFRNHLSHPIQLEGDWRVALAEIIFPSSIKNITTKDFFIYTPKTPYVSASSSTNVGNGLIRREAWEDNATFQDGELKTIATILEKLEKSTESDMTFTAVRQDDEIELQFEKEYGISVRDRSLFDVLGFQGVPDPNRGGFFLGNHKLVSNMKQPIKNDYPPDLTAGISMFFVNTDIIEHQHVAGVKSPLLRIIETSKRLQKEGELKPISTTTHKVFSELQFKKLITSTIEEVQIEIITVTGQKVPFVGTGRVALTLKFRKF